MIDQLIQNDQELFLFLNNLGTPTWDAFWLIITNKLTFIPLYALLLFFIYKKFGLKTLGFSILLIVLMVTFTDQITNLFKDGFQRARPCRQEGVMERMRFIAVRCGKYGFFSGHASNTMAAAVFAGLLLKPYYKNLIFMLLFWSVTVAYSRIYVGVHYPLDVICGMSFGALSGFMFYKILQYVIKRFVLEKNN
ncbi:phosphatase PAP2 family protein [Lacinutrix sp. C3R15]|uniref:phosphatase PAP2 family protein n=1 Tax=Flavobacteriaceae TaxID=49546 RepID=UPI001C08F168|nr:MULTISPECIES: phosphatase PAP2 family protein [Flavobacteriaceae]MBU2939524.1 phosphatase PAP2 family protein [Lacinutrix sp. C3R15]MDO6622839.1 phosphatase PAP2 family protein [Oceanihabitans sp. 1_MG-2023]